MIRRRIALAALSVALVAPAAAQAQQPVPPPAPAPTPPVPAPVPPPPAPVPPRIIAAGVSTGGVHLSGLTLSQARRRLTAQLRPRVQRKLVVITGGHRYHLRMRRIGMTLDPRRTALRAYAAGLTLPPPDPATGAATASVGVRPKLRWKKAEVAHFVQRVDRLATVAPRDATVTITVAKIYRHRSQAGRALDEKALRVQIGRVLADPVQARIITMRRTRVVANITTKELPSAYPTILTIDRRSFTLRLFKRLKLAKTYPIAVGAAGYDTPVGVYHVQSKQVNPAWYVPDSPWAGDLAGTVVPGGAPGNPLVARWIGVNGAVGIHGTNEPWSVGSAASHGCIRMRVPDVIDLFDRVPMGAPVLIR